MLGMTREEIVLTKQDIIREEIKEFVLEVRQYLCNTEFAPEPFTEPVDIDKLTKEFPKELMKKLSDLGVVIKVDRELEPINHELVIDGKGIVCDGVEYVAVEKI